MEPGYLNANWSLAIVRVCPSCNDSAVSRENCITCHGIGREIQACTDLYSLSNEVAWNIVHMMSIDPALRATFLEAHMTAIEGRMTK
jgi:hypothetical protein